MILIISIVLFLSATVSLTHKVETNTMSTQNMDRIQKELVVEREMLKNRKKYDEVVRQFGCMAEEVRSCRALPHVRAVELFELARTRS